MFHHFFTKQSTPQKTKTLTREQESVIVEYINHIEKELLKPQKINDKYQFFLNFNLKKEKLKLQALLASEAWQSRLRSWDYIASVHYPNEKESLLPKGKVCITIRSDIEGLPEYLKVSYAGTHASKMLVFDLRDTAQTAKNVKNFKLTYITQIDSIRDQIADITHRLAKASEKECNELISKFNTQWQKQLTMTLTINTHDQTGFCIVTDRSGSIVERTYLASLSISSNSLASTPQIHTYSFWNKDLPCKLATAALVSAAVASAYLTIA